MTAPLSQDLRERIVQAVEDGSTMRQAGRRFAVSASAAIKLMERVRQTGSTAPAKIGGHRRPILEPHADTLRAIATSKPGITLKEMRDALHARGIVVKALSTIAAMLHRLGLSHKKTTAAKLAVWQTGAIRFAVELEGRDGQTPVKDAGSGTHLTPAAPPVPGVRGRDAHPL